MSDVKLYVYDLSRGLASQLSLMLTGKQINGIWHTSVVVYGREIFFGQGVLEAKPGTTHHGHPVQVIDCGKTEVPEEIFDEYLEEIKEVYTADKYHLIDYNCNHFTADLVGFLTGAEIPSWISGLPAEFLSTPFGQAMRPQIDAMFRRTAPTEHPVNHPTQPAPAPSPPVANGSDVSSVIAASIIGQAASQATAAPNGSAATAHSPTKVKAGPDSKESPVAKKPRRESDAGNGSTPKTADSKKSPTVEKSSAAEKTSPAETVNGSDSNGGDSSATQ